VSVRLRPDGAGLTRVTLEAAAEVSGGLEVFGGGQTIGAASGRKKGLGGWWCRGSYRDYMHIC
jgi:hypothetical protein